MSKAVRRRAARIFLAGAALGAALFLAASAHAGDIARSAISASSYNPTVGTIKAASGTVTAPSFTFATDTDTGMFLHSANTLGFAAGGVLAFQAGSSSFSVYGSSLVVYSTGSLAVNIPSTLNSATLRGTVSLEPTVLDVPSDLNVTIQGGVNGLSFDGDTLSIDAANGRVGIATAAPAATLDVFGTVNMDGAVTIANGNNNDFSIGSNELFFDNSDRRLGVRTSSPQNVLHVESGTGEGVLLRNGSTNVADLLNNGSDEGVLNLRTGGSAATILRAAGTSTIGAGLTVTGASTLNGNVSSTGTLTLNGASPAVTVGASTFVVTAGQVGIGTASPATKLHLSSGTLTIDGNVAPAIIANMPIQVTTTVASNFTPAGTNYLYANQIPKVTARWTTVTTTALTSGFNISSLTDNGTGDTTVNFQRAFTAGTAMQCVCSSVDSACMTADFPSTASVRIRTGALTDGSLVDVAYNNLACWGTQ